MPAQGVPPTRTQDVKDVIHGVSVADPYRWLEDVKSPEVQAWMTAQDEVTRKFLRSLSGRDAIAARLKELYYVDSISPPRRRGTRYFYLRTHADREKAIYYWKEGADGKEQVLVDPNQLSEDGSTSVGVVVPSWDGKKVAYSLKRNNADEATLYVKDVATGEDSKVDVIEGAKYAHPSWTPTNDGFYYTFLPSGPEITVADRPGYAEVRFHKLGTDPKTDALLHERTGNPQTFLQAELSRDGHWLFATVSHGWNSSDVYYQDLRPKKKGGKVKAVGELKAWKPLVVGVEAQFEVTAWKDKLYIATNDAAPRWKVMLADPTSKAGTAALERKNWSQLIAEDPSAVIEGTQILGERLVLTYMRNASNELQVFGLDGKPVRKVELPGIGVSGIAGNPEDDEAYFSFNSFTSPMQIFKTSIASGASSLWAQVKLPIDPTPFVTEQVWYPSKDGTKISMFIVRRKDAKRDGSTPLLLSGYGGFNVPILPGFRSDIYPWLESGGIYAVPNLRGGGEYGEAWHKAGMHHKKQNVFDDFIGAAEYLIKEGYTRADRLAIRGGSNGGLLVGAAMTQRPDLYRAVVCAVPLLDMVRYHLFGSGKTWIPEYGTADDADDFRAIYAYSPYHHVQANTKYPALLMLGADSDDRVDPMHARKMTAALQAATSSGWPTLLRIEKHAGHGGADLVKQAVEQSSDMYAFLMSQLGLSPASSR